MKLVFVSRRSFVSTFVPLLASHVARLVLLFVWIETPLVNRAFHGGWLLPLLGILILPLTTLAYVLIFALYGNVTGWNWLGIVLALLLDLAAHSYPAKHAAQARNRRTDLPKASEMMS